MRNNLLEKNSIKQMLRTPVKTASFFIMITVMGFLISLASGMFIKTTANRKLYENIFKTIGTVNELPSSMSRKLTWDAEIKNYKIQQVPQYDRYVTSDELNIEGFEYIVPPEKRSCFASFSPEYNIEYRDVLNYAQAPLMNPLVEFSPVEDCVPDHSVLIHVNKVLFGHISFNYGGFWFCDHTTENPPMLYKDKKYITRLKHAKHLHGDKFETTVTEKAKRITHEYNPQPITFNSYDILGNDIVNGEKEFEPYYEVTDGFYDTPVGKIYLNYAKSLELQNNTFPVTATNSISLLLPFYNTNVFIDEGRDISKEAYDLGLSECLISKTFAENNDLKIGDSVTTNLIFTNCDDDAEESYSSEGAIMLDFSTLMGNGEVPQVFETKDYTIVGIYDSTKYGDGDPMYQLGCDEMIVPLNSIENKDKNILDYGPMNEFTTSFQIPNGTIDKYMEKWEEAGVDNIRLTFYDMGYTKLEKGMNNMRFMAIVFGAVGFVLGTVLLIFYSRMFIGNQKVRITIERCLGLTVHECSRSLLSGAMLLLIIGSIIGCIIGTMLSGTISAYDMAKEFFDMTYTVGHVSSIENVEIKLSNGTTSFFTGLVCELLIVAAGYIILNKDIKVFLRQEPLYLIDDINRE